MLWYEALSDWLNFLCNICFQSTPNQAGSCDCSKPVKRQRRSHSLRLRMVRENAKNYVILVVLTGWEGINCVTFSCEKVTKCSIHVLESEIYSYTVSNWLLIERNRRWSNCTVKMDILKTSVWCYTMFSYRSGNLCLWARLTIIVHVTPWKWPQNVCFSFAILKSRPLYRIENKNWYFCWLRPVFSPTMLML